MAKGTLAPFIQNSKQVECIVATASIGIGTDQPTNTELLATGGPEGSVIFDIQVAPRGTPAATSIVLYITKAGAGTAMRYRDSVAITTAAVTTTTAVPTYPFTKWTKDNPLFLGAGQELRMATQVTFAGGFAGTATQGDY